MTVITTDSRGRTTLTGHANAMYLMREQSDGSILLEPARVVTAAQADYDASPELQELLRRTQQGPTITRRRMEHRRK